jgi:tetratricopeptide (TPR) repeat protein
MDDSEAYYRRGIVLSVIKNYQDAIPHYDRAIQLRPNFAAAFYNKVSFKNKFISFKNMILQI